jgi:hypothetical protein
LKLDHDVAGETNAQLQTGGHVLDQCRCVIDPRTISGSAHLPSSPRSIPARYSRGNREPALTASKDTMHWRRTSFRHPAYEQAIGAKIETVVLAMNNSALESLALVHDWLTRLHWAREKKVL